MKTIYFLSGLGADERVFKNLNVSGYLPVFIQWEMPINNLSIEAYATKLLPQIHNYKPILVGLSFGGIIAMEIAKQIETTRVILISSAKTKYEIPFYYRFAGFLGLHRLLPVALLKHSNFVTNWFFGARSKSSEILLKQILRDTDPVFLKWTINKIAIWENTLIPENIVHIHGSSDRILPIAFVHNHKIIKDGGHLMILSHAGEISSMLSSII